ncbi:hypothetical protein FRUB_09662 [Fimbriiglobus ruber]|uniref:Uncharacterized protein n=1 Tax=Fimbriiglobus ruber TaxID=1908690 RepID=A0A225CZP0_9BACT|nr:hypothetical protein FRUB_09662 [Fimbriiglobus ruber]
MEQLIDRVTAAGDRVAQHRALAELYRAVAGGTQVAPVFHRLRVSEPDGPRYALEYLVRIDDPVPVTLAQAALPLLATKTLAVGLRLEAAGKLLAALPDDPRSVSPVVAAVTAGLSRSRTLERLLQLQSRVAVCTTLDAMVEAAEARVRLKCPKCSARRTRAGLIKHLWAKHRIVFEDGEARDPRPLMDEAVTAAATADDPTAIDETYLLSTVYYPDVATRQVFQALAARGDPDPTQTDRLLARAKEDGDGLCPVCLSPVPDPVGKLPPPAEVSDGQVHADGYGIEVIDGALGRDVVILDPLGPPTTRPESGSRRPPRLLAVAVALPVFALAIVSVTVHLRFAGPFWFALWLVLLGWCVYFANLIFRRPLPDRTDRAIDLAWRRLVPGIGRSAAAVRFLVRLCRASVGRGKPADRAQTVFELVEHATVLTKGHPEFAPFLAAARFLEVDDLARMGRERTPALIGLFEPFMAGEFPPGYAESVSEILLTTEDMTPGDVQRLGVLIVGSAFETGVQPADLTAVARYCPWFWRLALDTRANCLPLLHYVWRNRAAQPWAAVGSATTVFDFASEFPSASRRTLVDHPDTLLRIDFEPAVTEALGPVLLTARGLMVGGHTLDDPNASIEVVRTTLGNWLLDYGPHRIALSGRPDGYIPDVLKKWLRYRAAKLLPAARADRRGPGPWTTRLLAPLAVPCPLCGTVCVHRVGMLGTPWQAFAGRSG